MRQKSGTSDPSSAERLVKDIRRATRRQFSAEEKIRIVLDGLRGEATIAELCRREGIAESLYYSWSKEFLEVGDNDFKESLASLVRARQLIELSRLHEKYPSPFLDLSAMRIVGCDVARIGKGLLVS